MVYYGYSYFYIFFFFFLFFLLILILLSPNYKKKDVVPPLTTQNYAVTFTTSAPYGYTSATTDANAVFQPLRIQDGESGSGGSALDFEEAVQILSMLIFPRNMFTRIVV